MKMTHEDAIGEHTNIGGAIEKNWMVSHLLLKSLGGGMHLFYRLPWFTANQQK